MIEILKTVKSLNLNDCWIGAGFVRNKIWDIKHQKKRTKTNDIDVIYFDKSNTAKVFDLDIENRLLNINSFLKWSVKNQARMHIRNGHKPYSNCSESYFFLARNSNIYSGKIESEKSN